LSQPRLRWWRELAYVLAFYGIYSLIRNRGLDVDSRDDAFIHAKQVVHLERVLHSFHEQQVQHWFIDQHWFIVFWNVFYGTAHFVVTAVALVWLFLRAPDRYRFWRTTLMCTTALALLGYALYPLMPPRLLPPSYGFVDTLHEIGGLWSFDSGTMQKLSNQYAAMPSLHFAWSTWCACALYPMVTRRWAKGLVAAYPVLTFFAIVVTANHYWLDAAGGALVLGCGYLAARVLTSVLASRGGQDPADGDLGPDALEGLGAGSGEAHLR
jgi:hypothetical protein